MFIKTYSRRAKIVRDKSAKRVSRFVLTPDAKTDVHFEYQASLKEIKL